MRITPRVKQILDWYESDNPGTKANLARMLMHGRLGGTGKLVILPVDQGFEHGPARSFAPNPPAYDPHYHFQLAHRRRAQRLRRAARHDRGRRRDLRRPDADHPQAQQPPTAWPRAKEARRSPARSSGRAAARLLGDRLHHLSRLRRTPSTRWRNSRELAEEAKARGLAVVVWCYPRGAESGQGGRDRDRHLRLCRAHGGAAGRAHHQGEAADRASRAWPAAKKVYETQTHRHLDAAERASPTSCRPASTAGASSCSRAARRRDVDGVYDEVRAHPRRRRQRLASSAATRSSGRREEALEMLATHHRHLSKARRRSVMLPPRAAGSISITPPALDPAAFRDLLAAALDAGDVGGGAVASEGRATTTRCAAPSTRCVPWRSRATWRSS